MQRTRRTANRVLMQAVAVIAISPSAAQVPHNRPADHGLCFSMTTGILNRPYASVQNSPLHTWDVEWDLVERSLVVSVPHETLQDLNVTASRSGLSKNHFNSNQHVIVRDKTAPYKLSSQTPPPSPFGANPADTNLYAHFATRYDSDTIGGHISKLLKHRFNLLEFDAIVRSALHHRYMATSSFNNALAATKEVLEKAQCNTDALSTLTPLELYGRQKSVETPRHIRKLVGEARSSWLGQEARELRWLLPPHLLLSKFSAYSKVETPQLPSSPLLKCALSMPVPGDKITSGPKNASSKHEERLDDANAGIRQLFDLLNSAASRWNFIDLEPGCATTASIVSKICTGDLSAQMAFEAYVPAVPPNIAKGESPVNININLDTNKLVEDVVKYFEKPELDPEKVATLRATGNEISRLAREEVKVVNQIQDLQNSGKDTPAARAQLGALHESRREYEKQRDDQKVIYERQAKEIGIRNYDGSRNFFVGDPFAEFDRQVWQPYLELHQRAVEQCFRDIFQRNNSMVPDSGSPLKLCDRDKAVRELSRLEVGDQLLEQLERQFEAHIKSAANFVSESCSLLDPNNPKSERDRNTCRLRVDERLKGAGVDGGLSELCAFVGGPICQRSQEEVGRELPTLATRSSQMKARLDQAQCSLDALSKE